MGCLLSARLPIGVYLTGGYPTSSYFITLLAFDWVVPYVGDLVELRGVVCLSFCARSVACCDWTAHLLSPLHLPSLFSLFILLANEMFSFL